MRISDWSSDVCSSDLLLGSGFGHIDDSAVEIWAFTREAGIHQIGALMGRTPPLRGLDHKALPGEFLLQEHVIEIAGDSQRPVGIGLDEALHQRLRRSEEHTSELQSLMRISYAVFCLKKKKK